MREFVVETSAKRSQYHHLFAMSPVTDPFKSHFLCIPRYACTQSVGACGGNKQVGACGRKKQATTCPATPVVCNRQHCCNGYGEQQGYLLHMVAIYTLT